MKYLIDENTLRALLSYLAGRPWGEVDPVMKALMALEEAPADPTTDD